MDKLPLKQRKAVLALSNGHTRAEAAKAAGVTEQTVYNWLRDDDAFRDELAIVRDATLKAAVTQLNGHLELAINTLANSVKGGEVSAESVRAANYLLNHGKAYTELAHFGERLEEIAAKLEWLQAKHESEPQRIITTRPASQLPDSVGG